MKTLVTKDTKSFEILKVRAWLENTNKPGSGGQMIYTTEFVEKCGLKDYLIFWEKYFNWCDKKYLMLGTGVKDAKRKNIYEGDLLQIDKEISVVKYFSFYCSFALFTGLSLRGKRFFSLFSGI